WGACSMMVFSAAKLNMIAPPVGGNPMPVCVAPPRGNTRSPSPSANASSAASVSAEDGLATTSGCTPSTASRASAGRVCPGASSSSFAWSVAAVCVIATAPLPVCPGLRLSLRLGLYLPHHLIPVTALARPVFWCVSRSQGGKRGDDDTQTDGRHREEDDPNPPRDVPQRRRQAS